MALLIPNLADAAFPAQAEPDSIDIQAIVAAHAGTGVLHGCAVTAQGAPDMTVAVAAGQVVTAGQPKVVTAGNVTIAAADATNPRFDLIVADSTGTKQRRAGTAAASPVFPAPTAGDVVLAAVYVPANDTATNTNQIVDKRVLVFGLPYYDARSFGAVGDGTTDDGPEIQAAIDAAAASTISGRPGGVVALGKGTFITNQQIVLKQMTSLEGLSGESTCLKMGASFPTSTALVRIGDGLGTAHQSCVVRHILLDCADVAGSIGVYSNQAQELSGLDGVYITAFRDKGVHFTGAACMQFLMRDIAVAASVAGTAATGIYLENIGSMGTILGCTATANASTQQTTGVAVRVTGGNVCIANIHVELYADGIKFDGGAIGTVINPTGHSSVTDLVEIGADCPHVWVFSPNKSTGTNLINDLFSGTVITEAAIPAYTPGPVYAGRRGLKAAQGTLTDQWPALDLAATWNDATEAFQLIDTAVTDTASHGASNLIRHRVGGSEKFVIRKGGDILASSLDLRALAGAAGYAVTAQILTQADNGGIVLQTAAGASKWSLHHRGDDANKLKIYNADASLNPLVLHQTGQVEIPGSIRLGASATAGYVLTADATGVGSWQAPAATPSFATHFKWQMD